MYCIYRITNKLNGKTYIGQHKYKDLSEDTYMGSGKYLWRAIEKYGIENFEREILISEIKTKDEINQLEKEYIKSERDLGHSEYNISRGGDGGWFLPGENNPLYGRHYSEEHRKKISEAKRGVPRSEETKRKLSESHKRENLSEYTKKKMSESHKRENLSEETRKKLSEAHKGIFHSDKTKKRISEAKKGENNSFYGRHHSEYSRKKMSESSRISLLGKRYYNNGIECHVYIPGTEPEGYILGRLRRSI